MGLCDLATQAPNMCYVQRIASFIACLSSLNPTQALHSRMQSTTVMQLAEEDMLEQFDRILATGF